MGNFFLLYSMKCKRLLKIKQSTYIKKKKKKTTSEQFLPMHKLLDDIGVNCYAVVFLVLQVVAILLLSGSFLARFTLNS